MAMDRSHQNIEQTLRDGLDQRSTATEQPMSCRICHQAAYSAGLMFLQQVPQGPEHFICRGAMIPASDRAEQILPFQRPECALKA